VRFGFKTSPQHTSWDAMLDVWRAADDIELYESGWNFDHFYPIFSDDSHGPCLEGWTTLTALAQATRRIRVGVLVTGTPYRHPAVLANMAATVDIISGGRLELGLGAGWNDEEADAYGLDLGSSLTERFDRFDEYVQVVRSLLSETTTTFEGRHFQLTDAWCEPKPVQRPHPPIVIGGAGPRRTLPIVARYADHWNHPGGTVDMWVESRDRLLEACADIGRDPSEITMSIHLLADGENPGKAAEQAAGFAEAGVDIGIVYLPPPHTPAVLEAHAHALAPLVG
jgi:F420-dependent oxidoreductase-like protein